MQTEPLRDELEEMRQRIRLLRAEIADLSIPELTDLDSLLSVAEAEIERAMPRPERPPRR
ncbi:hypothetical protein SAZ10_15470 [Mesorhizobium sp. BAC0120]|uniref:hypothetical protein n=1 Tax=Mesorhizobium sp. BAC0120 TaxID=3090670 RepID=UPI00298C2F1E|nr:hypothetical protein [Mesorhizobium sp. BAC0120]MDW6023158.1 hypothetical protein [Mesorhizobium sp. BAC0120]